ncbi:MAG: DUF2298 domain-containing protein [Anaerolineae bacterium]
MLLLILLMGFILRVWHVDYADGQLPHPDERSTIAYYAPTIHLPPEGVSLFDKRLSPLNPLWNVQTQERRSYTYGHFPLYVLVGTANFLNKLAPLAEQLGASPSTVDTLRTANGVPGLAVVGRLLMALADTFTVLFVYLLADRIYGRRKPWVGLLAAAFSAFSVIQIQLSHFFAVDPVSTTFTAMALYGALRMAEADTGRAPAWRWIVFTGIGAGLAIASKFSALPILAAPVAAGLLHWWRQRAEVDGRGFFASLWPAGVALLVAAITFAVTSPFAILDWANFSRAVLEEQGAMVRGQADFPFTRQYRGTVPYVYQIVQIVRWGLGWPLGLLAFIALAWTLLKMLLGRARDGELIILSWLVPYFGLTGLFLAKFMRYMEPVTPFLLVFAAGLIAAIHGVGTARAKKQTPAAVGEPVEPPHRLDTALPVNPANAPAAVGEPVEPPHRLDTALPVNPANAPAAVGELVEPPLSAPRYLAAALALIALLGAVGWSFAFVNGVYNTTHPWITASRWIYTNVPDGSTIAWEQWDDSLPYDLPEPGASRSRYRFIDWGPFEEDTAEKFLRLQETLRTADYIVYSSNRIYGAVDNLPARYPMTNRYYQLMADGKLGYELALKQVNHPNLFGIDINDEHADESFTLYDHPTVLVYRKVRDLSDAEWNALLGGSWEDAKAHDVGDPPLIQRLWPGTDRPLHADAGEPGPGEAKSLLLAVPVDELPVVQDFRWNRLASVSTPLAVFTWWLMISLLGWIVWPISFRLFGALHDRGYLLSRSLGWLLVGYLVWIGASLRLVQFRTPVIVGVLVALALVSALLGWRQRAAMRAFWRSSKRLVLGGEALFAAAFGLFVLFRIANPDIWQPWNGGEKFMEFAFLNGILRSAYFPPQDPYFAGGIINYYYFGLYLVAVLIKLTGIASSVAFNLAIPTVFALAVVNVFSLAYTLAARLYTVAGRVRSRTATLAALLAAFFVTMLGNVDGGGQVVRSLAAKSGSAFESGLPGLQTAVRAASGLVKVLGPDKLPSYNYWDPSRVIPYTINEFPYWSFLFADLHPHMIGISFTVLFLALVYSLLAHQPGRPGRSIGLALALALTLGALAVINTWDLPTYFGLAVLIWLLREWRTNRLTSSPVRAILRTGLFAIVLVGAALLLYLPFFTQYQALASSGVGVAPLSSPLGKWLNVWGFLGFLAFTFILVQLRSHTPQPAAPRDPLAARWLRIAFDRFDHLPALLRATPQLSGNVLLGLGLAGLAAVVLAALDRSVPAVLLLPLLAAIILLLRRTLTREQAFLGALVFTALLVLFGVEIVYLKDHLQGGDWRRMNTLFKFYIQAWVMLGLALGVALPGLWHFIATRWHVGWRTLWTLAFGYLLTLSLLFLVLGTPMRLDDRFPVGQFGPNRPALGTLDGMAYMQAGTYTWHPDAAQSASSPIVLRADYDALRWMLDNITGTPVVAEALIGYYREGGLRVASFTGFPTLLGFHEEGEQRYGWQTGPRRSQAEEFWRTTDTGMATQLMRELNIDYIYVGQLEQIMYSAESLDKFRRMAEPDTGTAPVLEVVYSNDKVVLYHVVPAASLVE